MQLNDGKIEFIKKAFYERINPDEEYLGTDKPVNAITPLVSVIVTTYKHEGFITECLDGILRQKTDFPFEVLIGEDESPDDTRVICKQFAEKHPDKIRLFLRDRKTSHLYDEHGDTLCRFNGKWLGLSARGKYFASCEGDDYWIDENKLQKQVDFLKAHPDYSMCFHNAKVIYSSKPDTHPFVEINEGEYTGVELYEKRLVPTASVVFVADCVIKEEHFFNPNFFFGDLVLFLTLAECGRIWYFNELMSVYRKHEGGMMHQVFENRRNVELFIKHQKQILEIFPDKYKKPGFKNISWFYFVLFRVTFRENLLDSFGALIKSFYYSPSKCIMQAGNFLKVRLIRSDQ